MAAILQKVLSKEISIDELIQWIKQPKSYDDTGPLKEFCNVRSEFVPYFLNYLRDQTVHILQGSRSASNTPAKTPTTAKLKKLTTKRIDNDDQKYNQQPLFPTQLEGNKNDSGINRSNGSLTYTDQSLTRTGSAPRKGGANRGKFRESGGRSHRSIQFSTPIDSHKNKPKSLADFIKSPDNDGRQRSPQTTRRDDGTPTSQLGKRPGHKGKGADRKNRQNEFQVPERAPEPDFNLANSALDFPPIDAAVEDRLSSLPEGVKVITASRRIVPTRVAQSSSQSDSQLFKNAPLQNSGTKTNAPRGVWGQVANRDFSNKKTSVQVNPAKSKPSRRIAPTLLTTPSDPSNAGGDLTSSSAGQSASNVFSASSSQAAGNVFTMSPILPASASTQQAQEPTQVEEDADSSVPVTHKTPLKSRRGAEVCLSAVTPTKVALERMASVELALADPEHVTHADDLKVIGALYAACINNFLVSNLTVELYFLVQLLTARGGEMDAAIDISPDVDEILLLCTIHNTVYFAVNVLGQLKSILSYLDRGTLRMLLDNQRVVDFLPEFRDDLSELYDSAPSKGLPKSLPSPIGGVSFQADTDNRKNFPSERAFHTFKKQRDTFYELLREWGENHLTPGWSLSEVQGDKIQRLVGYRIELANHIHFARLFHSQLVQMCKGDRNWKKDEEDENITLLSELKQTNPKKLKQLRERLVTPAFHGGPAPSPSFPGCQEFFRDFISAACNPLFNQHLADILTVKITELNDIQLISLEVIYEEDEEIMIDVEDKETLLNSLLTSKLLAKFLGHVHFLPYRSIETLPESMQEDYLESRNKTAPPLRLLPLIEASRRANRTVITVPWVVEYLSMMDALATRLEYYTAVCGLLLDVYRETSEIFRERPSLTHLLVLTVLGWLYELPTFPQGLLYKQLAAFTWDMGSRTALNNLDVVDQQIYYSCCPYLGEIRSLLLDFAVGLSGRSNAVRKITPMSADVQETIPTNVTDKQLQHQLEENFFHNHPTSLKKTVEFVADRVSSNHIKVYRARDLPDVLSEAPKLVEDLALEIVQGQLETPTINQRHILQAVDKHASQLAQKGKATCLQAAPSYCGARCQSILQLLLPEETPSQVWATAALISYRQSLDKITNWLTMHITTHMFRKELASELEKQVKSLRKKLEAGVDLSTLSTAAPSGHDTTTGGANTSVDTPGGGSSTTPGAGTQTTTTRHKSFMFESPVRTLQDAHMKPVTEDSPMRLMLSTVSKPPASPSTRKNLKCFDDVSDKTLSARILSSRLSRLTLQTQSPTKQNEPLKCLTNQKEPITSTPNKCELLKLEDGSLSSAAKSLSLGDKKDLVPTMDMNSDSGKHPKPKDIVLTSSDPQVSNDKPTNVEVPVHEPSKSVIKPDKPVSSPTKPKTVPSPTKKLNVSFHEGDLDLETLGALSSSSPVKQGRMPKPCIVNHHPSPQKASLVQSNIQSEFCSPSEPLIALKDIVYSVTETKLCDKVTSVAIIDTIRDVTHAVTEGDKEVVTLITKMVAKLSVDLAFTLALRHPTLLTPDLLTPLLTLWGSDGIRAVVDFSATTSARYLHRLSLDCDTVPRSSYTRLVCSVIENDLLPLSTFLDGLTAQLDNAYLQPGISPVAASLLCDIVPRLRDDDLTDPCCDTLRATLCALNDLSRNTNTKRQITNCLTKLQSHSEKDRRILQPCENRCDETENLKVIKRPEDVMRNLNNNFT